MTYSSPSLIKLDRLLPLLVKVVFPPSATAKAVRTADFPPGDDREEISDYSCRSLTRASLTSIRPSEKVDILSKFCRQSLVAHKVEKLNTLDRARSSDLLEESSCC